MSKLVYVLLGDVVNSRGIKNRKQFEKRLQASIELVSRQYASDFYLQIKNWKGIDEIAAVLIHPGNVNRIIDIINEGLAPEQMRFVLARGELDIKTKAKDVAQLDGKVFHDASTRMLQLKKEKWLFTIAGVEDQDHKALENQINVLQLIKSGWTEKQRRIFSVYSSMENQEATAKKLKISQQSASKTLRLIFADQVLALENRITDWAHAKFANK